MKIVDFRKLRKQKSFNEKKLWVFIDHYLEVRYRERLTIGEEYAFTNEIKEAVKTLGLDLAEVNMKALAKTMED